MSLDLILPFLRPIAHLIADPDITEIMVNGSRRVFVERDGVVDEVTGVRLDERNGDGAWGAAASMAMNFAEADMTPEYELNEIIWKSVRGAASPMPPPVRAGFIRIIEDEREEADREKHRAIRR